ncbi:SIR2 family NAD-dependent deacetylase [Neisseria bacilliformis ATCC BAA-1200]|uniref:NAD-dependent protein deacylase n=1 Tax=Neisseria bacilliformis ATCC BAA-1200 TaxID=888742 RepID=F2BC74_9NEIS|nr:Sir2 family NAD-dependent protein deacetylase [Neisseria bacilliformis]EGF10910.1 SIR2 family NAD-dependent deacetylase [Neisseria bacilliformis ATCC BAA-1200]QMT48396.1 NAD-dependent deacylase [Neisseria bacilliformis]
MKTLAVLTGAGISAQSGLQTFRDSDGLWEGYRVEDVCTPEAFARNPQAVIGFYNQRRRAAAAAVPNAAHKALADLEKHYRVRIITQNVDDLHERAGSSSVLHLHGELGKLRSTADETDIIPWQGDQTAADRDRHGNPLRPHIVFFGEAVPLMDEAVRLVSAADIVMVVGTSLQVYPAASLLHYARADAPLYLVDPKPNITSARVEVLAKTAAEGVPQLAAELIAAAQRG